MADRRRRRQKNSGEESEEDETNRSELSDEHDYESAAEAEAEAEHSHESESEDACSEEGGEEQMYPSNEDGNGKEGGDETHLDTLKDGDSNQESPLAKGEKATVEEDRRNPAYIPKHGLFYEHDDRLESGDEAEVEDQEKPDPEKEGTGDLESRNPSKSQKPRRVYKADVAEKWGHDKFLEMEQAPKTKDELVSAYGYDIRNEDNAPRARRRRRYGRGPNKYTRNWEDEDAYQAKPVRGKPQPTRGQGQRRMKEGDSSEDLNSSAGQGQGHQRSEPDAQEGGDYNDRPAKSYGNQEERRPRGMPGRGRFRGGPQLNRDQDHTRGVDSPRGSRGGHNGRRVVNQETKVDNIDKRLSKVAIGKESTPRKSDGEKAGSGRADLTTGTQQSDVKPKRYSNLRPGRTDPTGEPRQQQFYDYQQQHRGDSLQFGNDTFPNTQNNGPPPDAPFLTVATPQTGQTPPARVALPTPAGASTPYMNPAAGGGMMNYGPPPPVAYGAVPVTVPIPLVGVSATPHHPPTDPIALMAAASHLNQVPAYVGANPVVAVSTNDQALLAQVHGGVTYFNPTAQAHVPMRSQVNKRPKAAIPIVDPSQIDGRQRQTNGDSNAQHLLEPAIANSTA